MRSTSSARRRRAAVLCVLLAAGTGRAPASAADPPAPSLLLVFHATDIPKATVRARMETISGKLLADLRVAWLPTPAQANPAGSRPEPRDADGVAIDRIAAGLGDAARRMERMETREAEALLDAAEREARSFRPGESLKPYFAEIFLRRGILLLWAGNRYGAEDMFGRVRVLRPDFAPDPALFSPLFRDAWARAATRPPPGAEILVQSIPPGADIVLGDAKAGTTPGRVRVPVLSPVVIRVARRGYLPAELSGYWLPGDSEMRDVTLTRDRLSRLEELVAAGSGGSEAGALLNEMAREAGAERVAVVVMTGSGPGGEDVRVLSLKRGDEAPAAAGAFAWPGGDDGAAAAGASTASLLEKAGWPAVSPRARVVAPWYHKWWIWAVLGVAVAGAAAGAGGGGGGSGGSTGAIGVNF